MTVAAGLTFGKYTLVRELGRGAMGVCFEAVDTQLRRRVALKQIIRDGTDPAGLKVAEARFIMEAQLAAKLKHPGIVSIFEAGVIDGSRYLAMEFVDGISMSKWQKDDSIPLQKKVIVVRDIALALHAAHRKGVIHRDVKPANILMDSKERPHVADFGLAKSVDKRHQSLTLSGQIVGSPCWMSPEQIQAKTLDRRTDLWSLGVMLYEIASGTNPFRSAGVMETLKKIEEFEPPTLEFLGVANRDLSAIAAHCLEKDREHRYATCDDLADDLTAWLKGLPVSAAPVSTLGRAVRFVRRRRAAVLAAAIAACVLTIACVGAVWSFVRAHRATQESTESQTLADQRAKEAEESERSRQAEEERRKQAEKERESSEAKQKLEENKSKAAALVQKADALEVAGDISGAMALCEQADALDPDNATVWVIYTRCMRTKRYWVETVICATGALEHDADDWRMLIFRSEAWYQLGDMTEAKADADDAVRFLPKDSTRLAELKKWASAIKTAEKIGVNDDVRTAKARKQMLDALGNFFILRQERDKDADKERVRAIGFSSYVAYWTDTCALGDEIYERAVSMGWDEPPPLKAK